MTSWLRLICSFVWRHGRFAIARMYFTFMRALWCILHTCVPKLRVIRFLSNCRVQNFVFELILPWRWLSIHACIKCPIYAISPIRPSALGRILGHSGWYGLWWGIHHVKFSPYIDRSNFELSETSTDVDIGIWFEIIKYEWYDMYVYVHNIAQHEWVQA